MVKKLISGLLKKKDGAEEKEASNESGEDVPEELPPLAEDVLEGGDAAAEAKPAEGDAAAEAPAEQPAEAASEEAPDELPSLDIEEHTDEASAEQPAETAEASAESDAAAAQSAGEASSGEAPPGDLPDAIKKAAAAKQGDDSSSGSLPDDTPSVDTEVSKIPGPDASSLQPASENAPKATEAESQPSNTVSPNAGFFASILQHIKSKEGSKEKLLGGDLFSRMSTYYDLKKGAIKDGTPSQSENRIEKEIHTKLEELQTLEEKWHVQKLALEEDLKFLHERERDIQARTEELKRLTNELQMFRNVEPKEYFAMNNGVVLRNIHDLLDALEIIDKETYNHHVGRGKNDFADWIMHVMKNKKFADKLRKAHSKEEMISLLESEQPIIAEKMAEYKHRLPPQKYFWLANGTVIKSLHQLSDALKAMEEELFEKHVSTKHNDFAHWIRDSLKNNELAAKLEVINKRQEMAHILDIYL